MCGIFACILRENCQHLSTDIGAIIANGLIQLQHRGQESAGIVATTGPNIERFSSLKGTGLVNNVFNADNLQTFAGAVAAVGHTRYSTLGSKDAINCVQPFVFYVQHGPIAVAHNGELINHQALRKQMLLENRALSTDTDSEMIALLLANAPQNSDEAIADWPSRILHFMSKSPLAYSLVVLSGTENCLYAVRDPHGNRPLCIGTLQSPTNPTDVIGWVLSSESCALNCVGAKLWRDIEPGEILAITPNGPQASTFARSSTEVTPPVRPSFCIFEYVYFASAASMIEGQSVYTVRHRCGEQLASEAPVDADIVCNVPETSSAAARGYSFKSNLPYVSALVKNQYVGRTFIRPTTQSRVSSIALKFTPLDENIRGQRLVLVDDSIVRGNTMRQLVRMLREHGAKEVHVRIAAPPIKHPCYMGINIPTQEELVANLISDVHHYRERVHGLEDYVSRELAAYLGADSVVYLSVDGLVSAVNGGDTTRGYCTACLTERYPAKPPTAMVDIEDFR